MVGQLKYILGASLAAGLVLATPVSAQADEKKKAQGDDFTEKLKERFPGEAKRGKKSIFRSVKDSETEESRKKETKVATKPAKEEEEEVEKPKLMLADLFKSKTKTKDDEKDAPGKEKEEPKPEKENSGKKETPKVMLADLFKSKPKKDTPKEEEADADKKKPEDKKKSEPEVAMDSADEEVEVETKPKFVLADLFKSKSKKDDDKALKEATANGASDDDKKSTKKKPNALIVAKPSDSSADDLKDDEMSTQRISAPKLFGKKKSKPSEPKIAETTPAKPEEKENPADDEEAEMVAKKEDDNEKEKSTGWGSKSKLFGKKTTKPAKSETIVIPEDSITNKPAPKIEFSKVDTSRDLGEGGDFTSWDDVPYKRKSTVDRMMKKLNIVPTKKPAGALPGPRLPGGPSLPSAKPE